MARLQAMFLIVMIMAHSMVTNALLEEVVGFAAGAVAVGVLGPVALAGLGFTAGGIAAGSAATWMMSAGLPVAVLQSAGAAGIAGTTIAAGGVVGAAVAHGAMRFVEDDNCK